MNLKSIIANSPEAPLTPVEVPEWGATVYVKRLNYGDKVKLIDELTDEKNAGKRLYVVAVLHCVCDQDGARVFTPEDYDLVASRDADAVLRVGRVAAQVNKLVGDTDPVADAKKKLRRNSHLAAMYKVCHEYGYTPDQVRAMSDDDVMKLIATIAPPSTKPLKWDQGGAGIVRGWATAMQKLKKGNHAKLGS